MMLKEATIKDLHALLDIERACFDEKDSPLTKRTVGYHLGRGRIVGAYEGEELLGYILIFPRVKSRAFIPSPSTQTRADGASPKCSSNTPYM